MTRAIDNRFRITGRLVAETPISVAGLEGASTADMVLATNGRGQLYVPGTSLSGPMRTWFRQVFGAGQTDALWGKTPSKNSEEEGHASYATVEDAVVLSPGFSEIRDGVGIDRRTGTAAEGFKFDRQVLPKGTVLCFTMTLEKPAQEGVPENVRTDEMDHAIQGMAHLLQAMQASAVRLGGAKTRGLGRMSLKDLRVEKHELGTKAGVLNWLRGQPAKVGGMEVIDPDHAENARCLSSIDVAISWRADGPLMTKSGDEGLTIDMLPLMSSDGDKLVQVLSGAGIKGALSAVSERICRTLFRDCRLSDDFESDFLHQLDLRDPLVMLLFGARKSKKGSLEGEARLGLGALTVDDCYGNLTISAEDWSKLLTAARNDDEPTFKQVVAALGPVRDKLQPAAHVAIDRWTGGAADSALYSVLEPIGTAWEPIQLTIDPQRLAAADPDDSADPKHRSLAALALLVLTLREMAQRRLPLGFAGNRGMGALNVDTIRISTTGAMPQQLQAIAGLELVLGPTCFGGCRQMLERLRPLDEAWNAYQQRRAKLAVPLAATTATVEEASA